MQRKTRNGVVLGLAVLVVAGFQICTAPRRDRSGEVAEARKQSVESYGQMPITFEANTGQADSAVKFLSRGEGYTLFITQSAEAVLTLRTRSAVTKTGQLRKLSTTAQSHGTAKQPEVLRMKLVGAHASPQFEGLEERSGKANYFIGKESSKWRTNVPLYGKLQIRDVYPGVDQVYHGSQRQLEQDFIVAPGADPRGIRVTAEGGQKLALDAGGNLVVTMHEGEVRFLKPVAYQEVAGERHEISSQYVLKDANTVGFEVGAYDERRNLVIDPVLSYSTYLGGEFADQAFGIAVDSTGNAYITGQTQSPDFPITGGAFQTILGVSNSAAFITKLSPSGALLYSTFVGGSNTSLGAISLGAAIAIDTQGNTYITGETDSPDFPVTAGAFQAALAGKFNAFVTKLNSTGSALVYSTYVGGSSGDIGNAIAVDSNGSAYITGQSQSSNYPTTTGAFQVSSPTGITHGFVTKLNSAGTALVYSTYLGGSIQDQGNGIRVDSQGNAYLTGYTKSVDFPVTAGAFQTAQAGGTNAFVTKLSSTGSALVYSTYFGGNNEEIGNGIAIDSAGNTYITGVSDSNNMPTTPGAFRTTAPGNIDAFVAKFNSTGSALVYSTYLGGTNADSGSSIAVDFSGNAFVFGGTSSADFPTANPIQAALRGTINAFVTVLNPSGASLIYSSFLGGTGAESGLGAIALDGSSNAYVSGSTNSVDFPTTAGALQTTAPPFINGFVTKISGITCISSSEDEAEGEDEKDNRGHHDHRHPCKSRGEDESEDHDR